jgi:hypothetical protein
MSDGKAAAASAAPAEPKEPFGGAGMIAAAATVRREELTERAYGVNLVQFIINPPQNTRPTVVPLSFGTRGAKANK